MTTPTRSEIEKLAMELWKTDQFRKGCMELAETNPEYEELLESGYVASAQSMLMRSNRFQHEQDWFGDDSKDIEVSGFQFDVKEALASGAYISGTTGSGKSDLAMLHAEEMMKSDVTVLVFDATRDWIKRSSVPHVVSIVPNVPYSYVLNGHSMIFDMSLLNPMQQKEVVKKVCKDVWSHQVAKGNHWFYLIFEEGHLYFPEGCMRSKNYAEMVQLVTQGRNYKIRFEVITQFSAMIDKNVMRYMKQRFFGYTDEPNDTNYILSMLGKQHKERLMSLNAGQFIYKNGNSIKLTEVESYVSDTKPQPLRIQPEQQPSETLNENEQPMLSVALQIGSILMFALAVLTFVLG